MRGFRYVFLVCILSFLSLSVAPQAHAQQHVALGNATAELTGPWKFHIGDSPQANGRRSDPRWAQPDYDDSAWGAMDLTPPPGSYDPVIGSSGFVPGWTARGYKGYSGYAWYRLRVNVQDGQSALALKMPYLIDDAYQVYVNGQMVGEFGRFTARGVTAYENQPHAFSLPAAATSGPLTLAIRVWMDPSTLVQTPDAGGMHGPPILGQQAVVNEILQLDWDSIDRSMYGYFMVAMALLLAMLVACGLLVQDPTEPAFLWLAIATAGLLLWLLIIFSGQYTTWIDATVGGLLGGAVLGPISSGAWVVFWAYWFRLPRMGRIHGIVWSAVALSGLSSATVFAPLYGTVVPVRAVVWLLPLTDALTALLGVLVLAVAVYGIRKDRREGWIALPAALLMAFWQYWHFLV